MHFYIQKKLNLNDTDNIKYLKMLDNKFSKKINFIENHVNIFNGKLTLSLRQAGAVSKKIFDCFFLVYQVHPK